MCVDLYASQRTVGDAVRHSDIRIVAAVAAISTLVACCGDSANNTDASIGIDPVVFCESVALLDLFPGFSDVPSGQVELVANEYLSTAMDALANAPGAFKVSIGSAAQAVQDSIDLLAAAGFDAGRVQEGELAELQNVFRATLRDVSQWAVDNCVGDLDDLAAVARELFEVSSHAPDGIDRDHTTQSRLNLYDPDAEIVDHPAAGGTTVRGWQGIQELIDREYEIGPLWGGQGSFGDVTALGDSVTWVESRTYEDGTTCTWTGNEITVVEGKITRHVVGTATCDS